MVLAPFAGVLASVGGRISMGCKIDAHRLPTFAPAAGTSLLPPPRPYPQLLAALSQRSGNDLAQHEQTGKHQAAADNPEIRQV
jgi:hypothetical protein